AKLHLAGTANIFTNATSYTGSFWNGTASVNGFEVQSNNGDVFAGIQRPNGACLFLSKPSGSSGALAMFYFNGTVVGSIGTNDVTTSYNTSSDVRLKSNRKPTAYGLNELMRIGVEDYFYKADVKQTLHTGFIAQDLFRIYPEAVQTGGDDPKNDPWMVDYSKLVPLLVKAVQEQQQIIEDQNKKFNILLAEMQVIRENLNKKQNQ